VKRRSLLFLLLAFAINMAIAQTYSNVAFEQGINVLNTNSNFGCGVSFYDFDQDGWDDITIGAKNQPILCYRNVEGNFEPFTLDGVDFIGEPKQILWVDYDNDGDMDLFVSYTFDRVRLYQNDENFIFSEVGPQIGFLNQPNMENWGATWGDYDRDGDLDLYSCKLLVEGADFTQDHTLGNTLYKNNGNGTFTDVSLQTQTTDSLGISYQALFTDVDQDGWSDLFVINDKWFLNSFYRNTGSGFFEDEGELRQLDYLMDAMCIAADDYDNDGDIDFYITNTSFAGGGVGNLLFKNDNGIFNTLPTSAGIDVLQTCWGSVWFDYDNNSKQDLWVTANFAVNPVLNPVFRNDGDDNFTQINAISGLEDNGSRAFAIAMGDLNNDGYPDIIQGNASPYPIELYLSSGGDANWLKVELEGVVSNKDAVGSKIRVYTPLNTQYRETYCGEGYLSQHSQREMFGLGDLDLVDSLSIDWPSGMREVYYDLPANESYHFIEGATFQVSAIANQVEVCPGDSTLLIALGLEGLPASWNTGFVGDSMYVSAPGSYSFSTQNSFGITASSNAINIANFEALTPSILVNDILCFGDSTGSAALQDSTFTNILWENGEQNQALSLPFGWNSYTALDANGCAVSDSVFVDQNEALTWSLNTVNEIIDVSLGAVVINPSGGTPPYTFDWLEADCNSGICNNLSAGEYTVIFSDASNCNSSISVSIEALTTVQNEEISPFRIFPNPAQDYLVVEGTERALSFEIRNGKGQLVLFGENISPISIEQLSPGLYLLLLKDSSGLVLHRSCIMKQ
jgi:hypothetical protein